MASTGTVNDRVRPLMQEIKEHFDDLDKIMDQEDYSPRQAIAILSMIRAMYSLIHCMKCLKEAITTKESKT